MLFRTRLLLQPKVKRLCLLNAVELILLSRQLERLKVPRAIGSSRVLLIWLCFWRPVIVVNPLGWRVSSCGAFQIKREKKRGRAGRDQANRNPLASSSSSTVCQSCGQTGHVNARAKVCPNHPPTIKEKFNIVLGRQHEEFTRRIPFNSIVSWCAAGQSCATLRVYTRSCYTSTHLCERLRDGTPFPRKKFLVPRSRKAKAARREQYAEYCRHFFTHHQRLFNLYGPEKARTRFYT